MFTCSGSNSVHICEEPVIVDAGTDADNSNGTNDVDQDKETEFGELKSFE